MISDALIYIFAHPRIRTSTYNKKSPLVINKTAFIFLSKVITVYLQ
jgi:hypothetical protein